jgi:hypothetical protein
VEDEDDGTPFWLSRRPFLEPPWPPDYDED